jgi:hypothetical protein
MCRRFSEKVLFVGHDLFQQRMILHRCYTTLVFRNDNNLIVVAKNSFGMCLASFCAMVFTI